MEQPSGVIHRLIWVAARLVRDQLGFMARSEGLEPPTL